MARTGPVHHVGTFLIFAAFVLLLVVSISSPVINDISLLKVTLTNRSDIRNSSVTFGSFGHCVLDVAPASSDQDACSKSTIGYSPAKIMESIDNTDFSTAARDTADGLTRAFILHPIACGVTFIAFLLALGAGVIGSIASAFVAAIAWIITLVVMVIDFVCFGIIRDHVNGDGTGSRAKYGVAIWLVLAAMIVLFFGMCVVLISCCSGRMHKRDGGSKAAESGYAGRSGTTRRKFWQRR